MLSLIIVVTMYIVLGWVSSRYFTRTILKTPYTELDDVDKYIAWVTFLLWFLIVPMYVIGKSLTWVFNKVL